LKLKYVEKRFYEKSEVVDERRSLDTKADNSAGFINLIDDEPPAHTSSLNNAWKLSQDSLLNGTCRDQRLGPASGAAGVSLNDGFVGSAGSGTDQAALFSGFQSDTIYGQPHVQNYGHLEDNINAGFQVSPGNQVNPVCMLGLNGQSLLGNKGNFINKTSGSGFNGAYYTQQGIAGVNHPQGYSVPIQSNPNIYTQVPMQNQLSSPCSTSHPVSQINFYPSSTFPSIVPNNQQVCFNKPSDPFEQLIEEEKQQKFLKYANKNNIYPQQELLLQQFRVQTQLYEQHYGVPFPYGFEQWISMNITGQEFRPHSKNPFSMLV
jgi:hypothetical protein